VPCGKARRNGCESRSRAVGRSAGLGLRQTRIKSTQSDQGVTTPAASALAGPSAVLR